MRYLLTRGVMGGGHPEIEVSEAQYRDAVAAKEKLLIAVAIEEKLSMLLENFREFELELLEQSLMLTVRRDVSADLTQDRLYAAVRKLCNVLSAARLYTDQACHSLSDLYPADPSRAGRAKELFSREYDEHFEYRLMEALRNHAQHRSVPMHALKWDHETVESGIRRIVTKPMLRLLDLFEDGKVKRTFRDEIQAVKASILDLRPVVRIYVASMASVQRQLRQDMADDMAQWDAALESLLARWQRDTSSAPTSLVIVVQAGDGNDLEEQAIFTDFVERRRALARLAFHANGVDAIHVSSIAAPRAAEALQRSSS